MYYFYSKNFVLIIEIINNTRGGIAIFTSGKKGMRLWGANLSPGMVRSFNLANESMILYPGPKFVPH